MWLLIRLWLGVEWLQSGVGKLGQPGWMETGATLQKFWERAVVIPEQGRPVIAYDWYRGFLQLLLEGGHYTWFAKLVAVGETAVGLALILGLFTGMAAFFGVFMNWHFVMAGTASVNALLGLVGVLLVMAWKTAGWIGLDRWVLPAVGTPWQPGGLFFPPAAAGEPGSAAS
ncbi:MAG: DoxX family membrane protein [Chloroflexi bacterium]|nr:DoxX family membrane protein [Chloroflexota bacterium]